MNELQKIIEAYADHRRQGMRCALASIIYTTGSTYRRAGARMLITADGRTIGSISGGCLEADVIERARGVLCTGEPLVVSYDTRSNEDLIWGMGLGCQGVVEILIESLTQPDALAYLAHTQTLGEPCVLATVVGTAGRAANHARVGERLLLTAAGVVHDQFAQPELAQRVSEDAQLALAQGESTMQLYGVPGEEVKVHLEVIEPPVPLLLFGAGADALPVLRFARALGWHVTVVDTRAREATRQRFSEADEIILCHAEEVATRVPVTARSVGVLMSHNYMDDLALLEQLPATPLRYLGVLGPRKRTERLLAELAERSSAALQLDDPRLHSPIGLDIGADTPEEIALSILAEIRAVLAGRSASFLKARATPIHATTGVSQSVGALLQLNATDLLPHAAQRAFAAQPGA